MESKTKSATGNRLRHASGPVPFKEKIRLDKQLKQDSFHFKTLHSVTFLLKMNNNMQRYLKLSNYKGLKSFLVGWKFTYLRIYLVFLFKTRQGWNQFLCPKCAFKPMSVFNGKLSGRNSNTPQAETHWLPTNLMSLPTIVFLFL